jgi:hypothetical protein
MNTGRAGLAKTMMRRRKNGETKIEEVKKRVRSALLTRDIMPNALATNLAITQDLKVMMQEDVKTVELDWS